jgi:hypothetical protein
VFVIWKMGDPSGRASRAKQDFGIRPQRAKTKTAWIAKEPCVALDFVFCYEARAIIIVPATIAVGVVRFVYRLKTLADIRLQDFFSPRKRDNCARAA